MFGLKYMHRFKIHMKKQINSFKISQKKIFLFMFYCCQGIASSNWDSKSPELFLRILYFKWQIFIIFQSSSFRQRTKKRGIITTRWQSRAKGGGGKIRPPPETETKLL